MIRLVFITICLLFTSAVQATGDLDEIIAKARSGNPDSQVELAFRYRNGDGLDESEATAVDWFGIAANQGHAIAQYHFGRAYQTGKVLQKDDIEATKWFRKAAEQGVIKAQRKLGSSYALGRGVPRDYKEANKWFRVAADGHDHYAKYYLGISYYKGLGVQQDNYEAARWFRKAAETGYAAAEYRLGGLYLKGHGVQQNDAEAAKLMLNAANQGYTKAQHMLGLMYIDGRGVHQDKVEAQMWLSMAAIAGLERAMAQRDELAISLSEEQLIDASQRVSRKEADIRWSKALKRVPPTMTNVADARLEPDVVSTSTAPADTEVKTRRIESGLTAFMWLLISGAFIFSIFWVNRGVRQWLAGRIEGQYHGNHQNQLALSASQQDRQWLPFKIATGSNLVFTGIALTSYFFWHPDMAFAYEAIISGEFFKYGQAKQRLIWPSLIPIAVFYYMAFYEFVRPRNHRNRRYDYVLAGVAAAWVAGEYFEALLWGSIKPLIVQLIVSLFFLTAVPAILAKLMPIDRKPGRRTRRIFTILKMSTPVIVFLLLVGLFIPWIFIPFLLIRFQLMQWMEKYPIIYLRSFSQDSAPKVFRKVVSKECNRVGVLLALTHSSQTGSSLRGDAPMYEGSQFTTVPDDQWQAWVTDQLNVAVAVIIDDTVETTGIGWEINEAMRVCDPEKVIIFRSSETMRDPYPGITHLAYDENLDDVRKTRTALRNWLFSATT